ncbi:GntR family transcriptional regulator [Clostridium sp. 'White wine YQ']|uniref:GntR family transcriptional regulator n=1 Tax=Clostridium sp. 'White wine YQ' TaxID=3027474 RepID=UPI002367168B|nr:GntR family transcriptional regulator [Clostridium sp. 'White wine YQ']MDD7793415.1 GntR family transcriptional regulator [Clostridium sp. 'White wine YQ']
MILNTESIKPIYIQISEWLENQILNDSIAADEKMYSQYQLAEMYNINPATAAKGITILLNENILYKKRGLGMFVSKDAKELIFKKRKNETLRTLAIELLTEANRLNVGEDELFELLKSLNKESRED